MKWMLSKSRTLKWKILLSMSVSRESFFSSSLRFQSVSIGYNGGVAHRTYGYVYILSVLLIHNEILYDLIIKNALDIHLASSLNTY